MLNFAVNGKQQSQSAATAQPAFEPEANFIMPPPSVLWAWLSYVYECTGEWLMPPTTKAINANSSDTAKATNLTRRAIDVEQKVVPNQLNQILGTDAASFPIAYQPPIPAMLPYAPVAPNYKTVATATKSGEKKSKAQQAGISTFNTSNFSYVKSAYFLEAERLINFYSIRPIKAELVFGCKLVLTLVLAWCHFPLFNGIGKREGKWMTLANERCTRELRIRAVSFKEALNELQEVGLLVVGQVNSGIITREEFEQLRYDCATTKMQTTDFIHHYWHPRSLQEKTHIYHLAATVQISPSLPAFKPFSDDNTAYHEVNSHRERLGNTQGEDQDDWERHNNRLDQTGKDLTGAQFTWEGLQTDEKVLAMSFPTTPCHDSIHDNDDVDSNSFPPVSVTQEGKQLNTIPNQLTGLVENLDTEQKIKFDFLNNRAYFANFSRKDGRRTLDSREALKFAINPELTIEKIKERYGQVNEMWLKGECRKSPLGLFHWTLTQDCDPRGTDGDQQSAVATDQARRKLNYQRDKDLDYDNQSYDPLPETTFVDGNNIAAQNGADAPKNRRRRSNNFGTGYNRYKQSEVQKHLGWEALAQASNRVKVSSGGIDDTAEDVVPVPGSTVPSDLSQLWESVKDDDLSGRFRLSREDMLLLEGSQLQLHQAENTEQPYEALVLLRSIVEERHLCLTTRSTIGIALRQRLGPGYSVVIKAADG